MKEPEGEIKKLLEEIRVEFGYDFTGYAGSSIKRRIAHYMMGHKLENFDALRKAILGNEEAFEEFVQKLSVNVTEMFRDPLFFKSLRGLVIPRLATYPFIRIWIAGCATGEEVYSLAILLHEEGLLDRSVIYATDINQRALHAAAEGIFPIERMKSFTENYLLAGGQAAFSEYYKAKYNSVIFEKFLKKNMVFSPHNLAVDKSFNEFQLILCRNVMIYFSHPLQDRVIDLFYDSLCNFGFLGLGSRESLMFRSKRPFFSEVDKKNNIFMKTG